MTPQSEEACAFGEWTADGAGGGAAAGNTGGKTRLATMLKCASRPDPASLIQVHSGRSVGAGHVHARTIRGPEKGADAQFARDPVEDQLRESALRVPHSHLVEQLHGSP
ncbi:hypothetical protein [Leucobacter sp. NPDC077196]|uniref:hypothetical protein n=1 Tax=Leucobacter sp. NPDC077196 TaxID=3154959 RepID=UPI00341A3A51